MTKPETSPSPIINIEALSFAQGAHLLLKRALRALAPGQRLGIQVAPAQAREFVVHLRSWCRTQGHPFFAPDEHDSVCAWIGRGTAPQGRWQQAERASSSATPAAGPALHWGLAARGALVEAGGPNFHYPLATKAQVWAETAPKLYAQAVAAQWNPHTAIPWETPFYLEEDVEAAVVQVMTYLIENENAALQVPARFLAQIHPHFREVLQLLALQIADEARHVEVFTRRATLRQTELGLSTVGGQQSLKTLLDEPDFARAAFLLSVLGEGTFLHLLWFLEQHAPDPVTRQLARLVGQDEARHVAFGLGHLQYQLAHEPALRAQLAHAVTLRHDALAHTAGLNEEVFDALVLLAAGSWQPTALAAGFAKVQALKSEMQSGRQGRLQKLGFSPREAAELAALHTRNFM